MSGSPEPRTALWVPVREIDTAIQRRALAVGWPYRPQDGGQLAHVVLFDPFVPESALDETMTSWLEEVFDDIEGFGFDLADVVEVSDGGVGLVPQPDSAFRELVSALLEGLPDLRGRFDPAGPGPHVPVPLQPGEGIDDVRADLGHRLPLACRATTANVMRVADHDTRTLLSYPFGFSVA